MSKSSFLITEITASHIKLLQVAPRKKNKEVYSFKVEEIKDLTEAQITSIFSGMVSKAATSIKNVIAVIPRRHVTVVPLQLPSQTKDELKRIIDLQVVNWVPFPKDEIVYDFSIIHQNLNGYSQVLIVIVHRDKIQKYINILQSSGVVVSKISVSSFGILQWQASLESKSSPKGTRLVVCVDEESLELCFCTEKKLTFSREINVGFQDLNSNAKDHFLRQLRLTISVYQRKKMGDPIEIFLLVSTQPLNSNLLELLKGEYAIPIESYVLDVAKLSSPDQFDAADPKTTKTAWCPLLGFLSLSENSVNFLPKESFSNLQKHTHSQSWRLTGVLLGLGFLLFIFLDQVKLLQEIKYVNSIEKQIEDNQLDFKKAKIIFAEWEFIRSEITNQKAVMPVLEKLTQLLPADIAISFLNMDSNDTLIMEGICLDESTSTQLKNSISKSPLFKNLGFESVDDNVSPLMRMKKFKLKCQIVWEAVREVSGSRK